MRINNKKYEFKSIEDIKIVHISDIHFSDNFNLKNLDLILENSLIIKEYIDSKNNQKIK